MARLLAVAQLVTWLFAAAYFSILLSEKIQLKPSHKDDIIAYLEKQVNYESTDY